MHTPQGRGVCCLTERPVGTAPRRGSQETPRRHRVPSPRRAGHASARRALPTVGSVRHPGTCVRLQRFGGTIWECCHSRDFHVRPGQECQPSQRHQTVGSAGYGWSGVWTAAGTVATARDQRQRQQADRGGGFQCPPPRAPKGHTQCLSPKGPAGQPSQANLGAPPCRQQALDPVLRPRGGEGAEGGLWAIEDEAHPGFLSPHPQRCTESPRVRQHEGLDAGPWPAHLGTSGVP